MSIQKVERLIKAQAYGDSIGLATEFMSKEKVIETYGKKFITHDMIVQDYHRTAWKKGDWTDDTDLFLLCLRELVDTFLIRKTNIISDVSLAVKFKEWYNTGFKELGDTCSSGIGNVIRNVITDKNFLTNPIECARKFWILGNCSSSSNGSIMRNSIFGCLPNIEDAIQNSIVNSKVTHYSPDCILSCIFLSVLIHLLIYSPREWDSKGIYSIGTGTIDINTVIEKAFVISKEKFLILKLPEIESEQLHCTFDDEEEFSIENEKKKSIKKLETCVNNKNIDLSQEVYNNGHIGYVYVPIICVIYALKKTKTEKFKDIIQEIIQQGCDADTNACIVGAVISTQYKVLDIPQLLHEDFLNDEIEKFTKILNCERSP